LPNLPQKVETVETLYYKLHLLSFWVKTPTLSQIEPYRVVVLLKLISFNHWFDWMKKLAKNIICLILTKSSNHSCFSPNFSHFPCCFKYSFFFIWFQCSSFFNLEWAKYMASAVLLVLQEHTVFLTTLNYFHGWSLLFPDFISSIKMFLWFVAFWDFCPTFWTTPVQTIRECHKEHSGMQMKRSLKPAGGWLDGGC